MFSQFGLEDWCEEKQARLFLFCTKHLHFNYVFLKPNDVQYLFPQSCKPEFHTYVIDEQPNAPDGRPAAQIYLTHVKSSASILKRLNY